MRCNNCQAVFNFPHCILPPFLQDSKASNSTGRQNKKMKPGGKKQQKNFYCESVQGEYLNSFQQLQKTFLKKKKKMKYGHRKEKSWVKTCWTCPKRLRTANEAIFTSFHAPEKRIVTLQRQSQHFPLNMILFLQNNLHLPNFFSNIYYKRKLFPTVTFSYTSPNNIILLPY